MLVGNLILFIVLQNWLLKDYLNLNNESLKVFNLNKTKKK